MAGVVQLPWDGKDGVERVLGFMGRGLRPDSDSIVSAAAVMAVLRIHTIRPVAK